MSFDRPPRHQIYRYGERASDRALSPAEFAAIQIRAARGRRASLLLALVVIPSFAHLATTGSDWAMFLSLILMAVTAFTALPLYHAFLLGRVRPGDRVIEVGSHVVDGRGLVLFNGKGLTWRSILHEGVTRAAVVPESARAALEPRSEVSWTRSMSPDEVAEFAGESMGALSRLSALSRFSLMAAFVILFLGNEGSLTIALLLALCAVAWGPGSWALRRCRPARLRVEVMPLVGATLVDWAEFLPDGRPWTIEGEPADWRRR